MWKGNVVRIYTGPDNRSHFEDLSLPLDAIMMEGHAQHRSPTMPVKGLLFRENQLGPQGEYHTPKQRQFVITISGAVETVVHDFPAGGWRIKESAEGIFGTVVNGQVLYEEGKYTGALPGKVLRNSHYEQNRRSNA